MMNLTKAEIRKSLKPKSPVSRAFEGPKFAKAEIRKRETRKSPAPKPMAGAVGTPRTKHPRSYGRRPAQPKSPPTRASFGLPQGPKKSPGRCCIRLGQRQGVRHYFRPGRASLSPRTHSGSERFQPERAIAEPRATPSA